jgi:outer membrane protein, heavy metal efflux system
MVSILFMMTVMLTVGAADPQPARADAPTQAPVPTPPVYELGDIIDLTLKRNPAVAGAEGVVEQSRGRQVAAGAYLNPSISGNSGQGLLKDTGRAAIGEDPNVVQSITEYNVTVGQPLEWPAKRAARRRAAEAGMAGAGAVLDETRLTLVAEVKLAFFHMLLAQREAELAKQNLATVEQVAKAVAVRVKSGESPQFEAIKADVEVLKANQVVTKSQNAVRVARVSLDTLTAGALGALFTLRGDFDSFHRSAGLDQLTVQALDRHPTIRRLAKQVEQAGFVLAHERESRMPNVTVNGSYWREIGREAFSAGLSVPTPLWYQRQGEITEAFGAMRQQEAEWLRARNELVRAVTQHDQDAKTAAEQIEVFERGLLKQAQEALRIAQFSFQQGTASLLEVLDAQRVYRQTQLEYAQARYELSIARAKLERSVGGTL